MKTVAVLLLLSGVVLAHEERHEYRRRRGAVGSGARVMHEDFVGGHGIGEGARMRNQDHRHAHHGHNHDVEIGNGAHVRQEIGQPFDRRHHNRKHPKSDDARGIYRRDLRYLDDEDIDSSEFVIPKSSEEDDKLRHRRAPKRVSEDGEDHKVGKKRQQRRKGRKQGAKKIGLKVSDRVKTAAEKFESLKQMGKRADAKEFKEDFLRTASVDEKQEFRRALRSKKVSKRSLGLELPEKDIEDRAREALSQYRMLRQKGSNEDAEVLKTIYEEVEGRKLLTRKRRHYIH